MSHRASSRPRDGRGTLWDDLLAGEELAHLATEPAARAHARPIPDELDPRVRERTRTRIDALYRTKPTPGTRQRAAST